LGGNAEHVHLLILPLVSVALLMRWLKGSTARNANRILGRTGQPFWQDESFDHYLRNSSQIERTITYIEENPVSAGLVSSADQWPWSSKNWQATPPAPPNTPSTSSEAGTAAQAKM
jgi:type I restriction enzyme R subunit/putative DNA methylase